MSEPAGTTNAPPAAEKLPPVAGAPRVAICVITYRRPEGLRRLLRSLQGQTFAGPAPDVRIVVAENEADGPGRQVCEEVSQSGPYPIEHYVAAERGIPQARNASLRAAGEHVDYVAFIDDDEAAEPDWLDQLLRAARQYDAAVVTGPVLPEYDPAIPEWVRRGGYHLRRRAPTGTPLLPMGTNNVLVRRDVLSRLSSWFDERFALTGGSDSHFFLRVGRLGVRSVFADEARVEETVPATRGTARWIWARAFRAGANYYPMLRDVFGAPAALAMVAKRTIMHGVWGIVALPVALFRGRAGIVKQIEHLARAAGMFVGLFGFRYEEYRKIHGK